MKKICLLSGPDKSKKFNARIANELRQIVKNVTNAVVVAADPDNHEKNDKHFNGGVGTYGVVKTLKTIFPEIKSIILIDSRVNKSEGNKAFKKADIIYLLGGDPFKQINYLQNNKFDDLISKSEGLIMGVSAGSMNLAINSYYSKDEIYPESLFYKGLGLIDVTIDPHFDIKNIKQKAEILLKSKGKTIIGLPNESAIFIIDNNIKYVGKKYIFKNGKIIN